MVRSRSKSRFLPGLLCLAVAFGTPAMSWGADDDSKSEKKKPDFPPHAEVLKGFDKVVSTADGKRSLYTIWTREKDGQMYAELPSSFASDKYFIALTVSSGDRFAGLQSGDMYVYWRRYDKRLALIEPNVRIRSTGDDESKASVERLFTDRLVLDVPIATMGPGGGPVIDMDQLLVGQAASFFGASLFASSSRQPARRANPLLLAKIKKAKAFPENVELAYEIPGRNGNLQTLHYSISKIPDSTGYKPRAADERIGYFTTSYSDLGKYKDRETRTRYINRWHLEKADAKLSLSPPKEPIRFYIEHTTPVRYRRWVKQGILYWNQAFENVGISDAIEVEYQDAKTKANMDLDPEDVRYNFVRWLNNDIGTAIGPSRVHPLTGQILDADIVLTDGWIRHYWNQYHELLPKIAMEGFNAETLAWLAEHPDWDPRIRLAPAAQRPALREQIARQAALPLAGHPAGQVDSRLLGDDEYDGLIGRTSQVNGLCMAADGKGFDVSLMKMFLAIAAAEEKEKDEEVDEDDKDKEEKKKDEEKEDEDENMLDGIPEEFIGPLLAELVAHEVGHTLGLRHNFKSTGIYSLEEINSEKIKGKKAFAGSVMDYIPVNMHLEGGEVQGDYTMLTIGPYDMWAIEYGYTFDKDLKPILDRVAEPELAFATDEDTGGPDPLARRYDFSQNPLDYAQEQARLAKHHRDRIIDKFVQEGDSWSFARRGYELTLALQTRAVGMMANWIGGAFVHRDKKGDTNGRTPIEVVPAETQRAALNFVIDNTFEDEAFGLNEELLSRMTVDKWLDGDDFMAAFTTEPTWPVHDRVMGIQASALTMLMNSTTLRRVYDNEFRVPADDDALTLPELLDTIGDNIWRELELRPKEQCTARKPMISSLRRNLQREHLKRLIDLTLPNSGSTEAYKPIANLAMMELRQIDEATEKALAEVGSNLDPYSRAHLTEVHELVQKALDAQYIYNADKLGGGSRTILLFGEDAAQFQRGK